MEDVILAVIFDKYGTRFHTLIWKAFSNFEHVITIWNRDFAGIQFLDNMIKN